MTTVPIRVADAIAEVIITHRDVTDSVHLDVIDALRSMLRTDDTSDDIEEHVLPVYEHAIKMLAHTSDYTDARSVAIINAGQAITERLWGLSAPTRDPWAGKGE